jgi:hypothetical protein
MEKTTLSLRDIVDLESWLDPSFGEQLQSDTAGTIARLGEKYGVEVPADVEFRVVVDTDNVFHIPLSVNPAGDAPAATESEVSGYMNLIAAPTTAGKASSSTIFCNPAICSAVNPALCQVRAPTPRDV